MSFIFNDEGRIHINLSDFAWKIINNDLFNFSQSENTNVSGFINTIFINYYSEAKASIQIRCDEISSRLELMLDRGSIKADLDPSVEYSIIDFATKSFVDDEIKTIKSFTKGASTKIKLRNRAKEILLDSSEDKFYQGSPGNYIKAVVEEYCTLPFLKRESIVWKENHELILEAIAKHKQLKVTVRSGKEFNLIPYKTMTDDLGIFSYVIGLDNDSKLPVSYRISKIKLKLTSKVSRLTKNEANCIDTELLKTDASFLTKQKERIVVQLNKYGVSKYNSQLHMRPTYIEKIDADKYVFECSQDQILYYFFKFGSSAKILEPKALTERFKTDYFYALKKYDGIEE